jgi:hypothetical protein
MNFLRPGNYSMNAPLVLLAWAVDPIWAVPVIGLGACGLAYLLGRRFLVARSVKSETVPAENFLEGITRERRATPRRKGNLVEVVLVGEEGSVAGWVVDRSIGGLCLLLEQKVSAGATYKVRARAAAETTPWAPIVVKHCCPDGDLWEAGCQFPHTPNWNVLLQFG